MDFLFFRVLDTLNSPLTPPLAPTPLFQARGKTPKSVKMLTTFHRIGKCGSGQSGSSGSKSCVYVTQCRCKDDGSTCRSIKRIRSEANTLLSSPYASMRYRGSESCGSASANSLKSCGIFHNECRSISSSIILWNNQTEQLSHADAYERSRTELK